MNQKRILLLSSLAGAVLIGLVYLQLNWIKSALMIREAAFTSEVHSVFSNVLKKINHFENEMRKVQIANYFAKTNSSPDIIDTTSLQGNGIPNNSSKIQYYSNFPGTSQVPSFLHSPLYERAEYACEVIDSIIQDELDQNNMNINYEFNIFNRYSKSYLFKNELSKGHIQKEAFVFPLLSNDFVHQMYLTVYFPSERTYILWSMGYMLIISGLLIISVIFFFSYTISTIIKQKKLSEMKNDFINNMTHEFKTPISTVSLACQALSDKDIEKTQDLYEAYIGIIHDENKRLGIMAEKILQTAVIDKGELVLRLEWLNIHEIIHEVVKSFDLQIQQKGGKVQLNLESLNNVIKADAIHIKNVVNNLMDNAIKYSAGNVDVTIETVQDGDCFVLKVSDKGIGISKANQKRIFEKLYRVPTGNIHNVKGFGLGLSYVKAIVDKHGGIIEVQSQLQKGSTFILRLPIDINKNRCA